MPSIVNQPVIHYDFSAMPFQNSDGTHEAKNIKNCEVFDLPARTTSGARHAVNFKKGSTFQIPSAPSLESADMFCVEMFVNPSASTSTKSKLAEGQFLPFAFALEKQGTRFFLRASIHSADGKWYSCASEIKVANAILPNRWTKVACVFTGDDIVLFKENVVVGRRSIKNANLKPVGKKGIFIGTWVDGRRDQFIGALTALKIYNGIPTQYERLISQAIRIGIGAIESKYQDMGGSRSFLGAKRGPERMDGVRRFQVYAKGRIYWHPEHGAFEVHGAILARYLKPGVKGILGYPKSDETVGTRNSRVSYFEQGAIYWSSRTGAHEVTGESYAYYVSIGSHGCPFGLPIKPTMSLNGGKRTELQRATIYYARSTGAHEVHGAIRERYKKLGGVSSFLGFPITDEEKVMKGSRDVGRVSRFRNGAIYWSPRTGAFEVHGLIRQKYEELGGATGKLGFPISNETNVPGTNIVYNDFQKGIIVYRSGWSEAQVLTDLKIILKKAKSGSIDDGTEWAGPFPIGKDRSAELYTKTTIKQNGRVLVNNKKSGNKKTTANMNITKSFTGINSKTKIDLRVQYWDYDKGSGDDKLGEFRKTFELKNCFGLTSDFENRIVANQNMTSKNGDSPKFSSVRLEYSMNIPRTIDRNEPFRAQCWWRFDNFRGPNNLSRQMMADTFTDVDATSDNFWNKYVQNPLDSIFYEVAYKGIAAGGNCFGMSTEAARAMANNSAFMQPLHESYKATADRSRISAHTEIRSSYRNIINSAQSTQLGGRVYNRMISNILNAAVLRPRRVFSDVRNYIRTGNLPIITLQDLNDGRGHAVLAYDYKVGRGNAPDEIYVADPNTVWRNVPKPGGREKLDRICIFKNNTFTTEFNSGSNYRTNSSDLTGLGLNLPSTYMFAVPYSDYGGQQRSLIYDLLIDIAQVIATMVFLFGDAEVEQVSSGSKKLFGTHRGKRIMNIGSKGIRNFVQMPTFDVKNGLQVFAKKGKGSLNIDAAVKGTKTGNYEFSMANSRYAAKLKTTTKRNGKDNVKLENTYTPEPVLKFVTGERSKKADVNLGFVHDVRGRLKRSYELGLQGAKNKEVSASIAKYGDGILIENAGPRNPFDVTVRVQDKGIDKMKRVRVNPDQFAGSKIIQIRNVDIDNPQSKIIMEGLTNRINGSLIKRIIKPGL